MIKNNKKLILIGSLIWIICLVTTIIVVNKQNNAVEKTKSKESNQKLRYDGIDYYGYYDENDIVIDEITFSDSEKCDGEYIQISGLKNKDVENKINQTIYDFVNEKCNNGEDYYLYSYINGNFSNILSLTVYIGDYNDDDFEENLMYNVNLNDGSIINFEDIYDENYNIYVDITNALYEYYAELEYEYDDVYFDEELSEIEDLIFKNIQEIKVGNFNFSLSSNAIEIIVDDAYIYVPVTPSLAPYLYYMSRYSSDDSLFEKDNIGHKGVSVSTGDPTVTYVITDKGILRYDAYIDLSEIEAQQLLEKYSKDVYLKTLNDKVEKGNSYYSICNLGMYSNVIKFPDDKDKKFFEVYEEITECIVPEELNEKNKELFFDDSYGMILDFLGNKKIECDEIIKNTVYDETLKVISGVEDIFKDDIDYINILKEHFANDIGMTIEEIDLYYPNLNFGVSYDGIIVYDSNDVITYVSYEDLLDYLKY